MKRHSFNPILRKLAPASALALGLSLCLSSANAAGPIEFRPGRDRAKAPQEGPARSPVRRNGYAPEMPQLSLRTISAQEQFDQISSHGEGIVKSDVVKFLIDLRSTEPQIYFINGNYGAPNVPQSAKYHYDFAREALKITYDSEQFNSLTYFAPSLAQRKFIAGTVQKYSTLGLSGAEQFYGIQFYPQDLLAEEGILLAAKTVKKAFSIPSAKLKFVIFGTQQTVARVSPQLLKLSIAVTSINEIFGNVPYVAMNKGEAWGYIRLNPSSETLKANDIPLFDELPLDLTVVAATITTVIQDAGSHINLKSKERGTPNMVLRDQKQVQDLIKRWNDKPVHLTVSSDGYTVEETTAAEVAKHTGKKQNKPWVDFLVTRFTDLISFDEMAKAPTAAKTLPLSKAFGGKASKLGFLAHREILGEGSELQRELKYRLTPLGFGIPTTLYFDFVNANPALKAKIQTFVDSEMARNGSAPLTPASKNAAIQEIQNLFYSAKVPDSVVQALTAKMAALEQDVSRVYPLSKLKKVKFRSSSNAEDVEDFDGAGLHDSFSASVKKGIGNVTDVCKLVTAQDGVATKQEMEPETALCALRGVYASLWNKRAVEERSYARINHMTAGMGVAVNPTYNIREKSEGITQLANGVLITRIIAGEGIYGYQFSLNTEDNLVTNPSPGTQSEVVLGTFLGDEKPEYTVTQFAKTSKTEATRTSSLVTRETYDRIIKLARAVESGYCRANRDYYENDCSYVAGDPDKPKSLDLEFKIFSNGEVLVKQVREFGGR